MFGSKRRAYKEQRNLIINTANQLTKNNFNLKIAFKELIASQFYRVDGIAVAASHPRRQAELEDIGITRRHQFVGRVG